MKSKKILIVDDEELLRTLMTRVLEREHEVMTACSGDEAVEKLQEDTFDAMVVDLRMPGRNGVELYMWIKENQPGQEKKVIFTSGDTHNIEVNESLGNDQVPIIGKPFTIDKFKEQVDSLLFNS